MSGSGNRGEVARSPRCKRFVICNPRPVEPRSRGIGAKPPELPPISAATKRLRRADVYSLENSDSAICPSAVT